MYYRNHEKLSIRRENGFRYSKLQLFISLFTRAKAVMNQICVLAGKYNSLGQAPISLMRSTKFALHDTMLTFGVLS